MFAIARKTLADLAGAGLEQRMVDVFVGRLRVLDSGEKARLAALLRSADVLVLVRSAFDLAPEQRQSIENSVKEMLAATASVRFEVAPNLVSGIELVMNGQKVAWSISGYLASLEKGVNELLKTHRATE